MTSVISHLPAQTNIFLEADFKPSPTGSLPQLQTPFPTSLPNTFPLHSLPHLDLECQALHCSLSLHVCALSALPGPLQHL